jgi:hypothetical protein
MFRPMFSPILKNNSTIYTILVKCTDLLPIGDTVEMGLHGVKKRSLNGNCCILSVTYTAVFIMHGHTNIKFIILYFLNPFSHYLALTSQCPRHHLL